MHCFDCDAQFPEECRECAICGKPLNTDSDRYFKAGMKSMAEGDLAATVDFLYDCVALNPDHINGRYNLGMALALDDRCEEAMYQYNAILEDNPEYPGIHTAMGQAAFGSYLVHCAEAENQCSAMLQHFTAAIERDPRDVDAYFSLGNAYMALNQPVHAIPPLEAALRLDDESPAIYFALAKALKMDGRLAEAATIAAQSLQLAEPDDPFLNDIQELCSELQQTSLQM